jgi:uncharacterized protein YjbJ (UPF0337 family)
MIRAERFIESAPKVTERSYWPARLRFLDYANSVDCQDRRERSRHPVFDLGAILNREKENNMSGNTDKAAGIANEAAGKVKQGVGKAVGSEKLRSEGAGQEAKGDAQQLKGDAKNAVKDGVNKVADAANKKL